MEWLTDTVSGFILDVTGVLKQGLQPLPGSVEAIAKLQNAGFPFRLVTNESTTSVVSLHKCLNNMGFSIPINHIFHPIPAVKKILRDENLRPALLVRDEVMAEFEGMETNNPNCVVLGDATHKLTYENLNRCFRVLMSLDNPILFSLGIGKYFKDGDELDLDVGAFTKGLEYATGVNARVIGKPSQEFFMAAVNDLKMTPHEVVMVGDDLIYDVGGAQKCGIRGVLVRTGKFRKEDEHHPHIKPDAIFDNLLQAVNEVLFNK